MILYRLLRPDEDPKNGLTAKNPNSNVSVDDHVTKGSSGLPSKYISCCKSLKAVEEFAFKSVVYPKRIVRIELNKHWPSITNIIDLTEKETRETKILNEKGRNFAKHFEEVLVVGKIPPECVFAHKVINKK